MSTADVVDVASSHLPGLDAEIAAAREELDATHGVPRGEIHTVVSPYRICPLGAHSDHQGGTVLGMAVGAYTVLAFAANRRPGEVTVHSACNGETLTFALDSALKPGGDSGSAGWGSYARGSAWVLGDLLPPSPVGMVASVRGTLPGAGLSSSASVDLAYLVALATLNELELSPKELAVRAMRVETEYLGLGCGLLDPASIVGSRRHHLLSIDCGTETWRPLPPAAQMPSFRILVAFSGVTRQLVATGFNQRVAECGRAAAQIGAWVGQPGVTRLGELPLQVVEDCLERLPAAEGRRARHFTSEARRVGRGLAAWSQGDLVTFGSLVDQSCRSSIRNYECGSSEIVALHHMLAETPGVLGNRFSGGGFGGCCVALVQASAAQAVRASVEARYLSRYPELRGKARFFLVDSEDGVRLV